MQPVREAKDIDFSLFEDFSGSGNRTAPTVSFEQAPVEITLSWWDYMIGSNNNLPIRNQPETAAPYGYTADGKYAVFMYMNNAASLRRVYYTYFDADGNFSTPAAISPNSVYEGYPGIGIDPVTANPFVAWHSRVEPDETYDCSMSYDLFNVVGGPGLWSQPFIVIDNPEVGFPLTGNDNDAFLWPQVWVGPSPIDGKRRIHIYGNNAAGYNGQASHYNCIYGYADFQYDEVNFDMSLTDWTYQTFELFDYWQYNNGKRSIKDMAVSDDGQVAFIGHAEDEFFLYHSIDYGETFELHLVDSIWPVFNPQNQDGTYYFTNDDGSPSEMFIGPNGDGSHFNVLFSDDNTRIIYMTAFGLNSMENLETGYYLPAFFEPKIVCYDILTEEFSFIDLQVTGVDPYDNQPMIPYDLDEDGEVDFWDEEGLVEFAMCWPSHYFAGGYQDGSFHESCFKITKNEEQGWIAAFFMDGRYLMEAYFENPEYLGWEEKAQIAVSISVDDGETWSEPAYLNAKADDENYFEELDGMLPCYIYPADEIEYVEPGLGKIPIMFFDDNSYGSFVSGQHGQNNGGYVMYAELLVEFSSSTDDNILNPPMISLEQNYPNPFNPITTIEYNLIESGNVDLTIYNIKGQKIKTLHQGFKQAGDHNVVWNGTDTNNRKVSSGIYYYRLRTKEDTDTRKMVLMK